MVNATTLATNTTNAVPINYDESYRSSFPEQSRDKQTTPAPQIQSSDIAQITRGSSVPLDASHMQNLAAYQNYDKATQASLSALAETLRLHGDLLKQLGQG